MHLSLEKVRSVEEFYGYREARNLMLEHYGRFAEGISNLPLLLSSLPGLGKTHMTLSHILHFEKLTLILPEPAENSAPSWFGFLIAVRPESGIRRNEVTAYLESHRIQTRPLFAGNLTRHPCFEGLRPGRDYRVAAPLVNTDRLMNDALWVGVYPGMTEAKRAFMAEKIREFFRA